LLAQETRKEQTFISELFYIGTQMHFLHSGMKKTIIKQSGNKQRCVLSLSSSLSSSFSIYDAVFALGNTKYAAKTAFRNSMLLLCWRKYKVSLQDFYRKRNAVMSCSKGTGKQRSI
jgi:hypothetical protein